MMVLETVLTPGIAQLSYLIGDTSAGVAAVIDPRPDGGVYLDLAQRHGLAITHAIETHIHADFMSGSCALRARLGGRLTIVASGIGEPGQEYEHVAARDGDRYVLGSVTLTARHTPGHTPEHLAFEVAESDAVDRPWGVFSGDSLLVGSVGRPDLLGMDETEKLTEQLFTTMREYFGGLDDGVLLFPGHGAGSACGADIGDRPVSTLGYEKRHNPALQIEELDAFKAMIQEDAPPVPAHYPRLKKVNLHPTEQAEAPACPPLAVEAVKREAEGGRVVVLDTRDMLAFGGGHIPGAVNIGGQAELSNWAGDMLDPKRPILIIAEDDQRVAERVRLLWRVGFTRFVGYLAGGMAGWNNRGLPLARIGQRTVHEVSDRVGSGLQIVDVRTQGEWDKGHVPSAMHFYVGDMREGDLPAVDQDREVVVYCGSGYRASIAASLLKRGGFAEVTNVPGSWKAWRAAGLPVSGS